LSAEVADTFAVSAILSNFVTGIPARNHAVSFFRDKLSFSTVKTIFP
jgi:hypothetical protein